MFLYWEVAEENVKNGKDKKNSVLVDPGP